MNGDFESWAQDFPVGPGIIPLVIADGLGGHRGGQIASGFVINELTAKFREIRSSDTTSFSDLLNGVSSGLIGLMEGDPNVAGMGSTVVLVCVEQSILTFVNVGDSRAYFLDGDRLLQISVDDVPEPKAGPKVGPRSAAITQALGGSASRQKTVLPHVQSFELPMRAWSLLLCSDGISDFISDSELPEVFDGNRINVMPLVDKALATGGLDNISIIAASFRPLTKSGAPSIT
ncbi:PP2C family protein-serine/threonine phosphatase [Rhizobium rhizogenes]|uniref:PP2C family protein-serine/threonine phosphatase n=1 Tax=Rhizobium rhizogenes TaxID=359 RepID=UPI0015724BD0|nr:protein phosphatase 2C domain-containing protein [Rhizobium rhizogenes]NTH23320.1 serine/threonine-protein phosphatase [Rhizobium rhizogenes]NTH36342.1 serine/threonine-protein phosphatase [Rhizobium rhizogenes]